MLIELSKSFPWTIIMQILMAQLQNLITGRKIGFLIDCFAGARKWGQNYDLFIFQVLNTGAFLGLEMNSLGWY